MTPTPDQMRKMIEAGARTLDREAFEPTTNPAVLEHYQVRRARAQHKAHAIITAALAVARDDGWRLVPIEPTEAMQDAARDWSYDLYGKPVGSDASRGCWQAMLAAAPSPPAPEPTDDRP